MISAELPVPCFAAQLGYFKIVPVRKLVSCNVHRLVMGDCRAVISMPALQRPNNNSMAGDVKINKNMLVLALF